MVDLEALVAEVRPDWHAVFEALAADLDVTFLLLEGDDPAGFGLRLNGEDVNLDVLVAEVGLEWRAVFEKLAPSLDLVCPEFGATFPAEAMREPVTWASCG
jgi:hypothetical protein